MKLRRNAFDPYRPGRTADDFYWTKRWRKRRARQLQQEPCCALCLAKGKVVPATVADHVVSWRLGAPESAWNRFITGALQSLCRPCHEEKEGRRRPKVQIGEDGRPVDDSAPDAEDSS